MKLIAQQHGLKPLVTPPQRVHSRLAVPLPVQKTVQTRYRTHKLPHRSGTTPAHTHAALHDLDLQRRRYLRRAGRTLPIQCLPQLHDSHRSPAAACPSPQCHAAKPRLHRRQPHPLDEFAGMFKDDPYFEEVLEIMAEDRRKMGQDAKVP